jgi:anti-sigma regulatory factor (Ser/Thr protein kinase)
VTSDATILPPLATSVPAARAFVREALEALDAAGAVEDAQTLVSELATNAVLHARTPFSLEVRRTGDVVRIQVADRSVVLPRQRSYGADSTTGRGMRLIASIATDWGIEAQGNGKVVWFALPAAGRLDTVPAWDEDVDVDVLLASFGDGDVESGPCATLSAAA